METPEPHNNDVARDIGLQVEMLILSAKRQSETKVSQEIQKIKQKIDAMGEKVRVVTERVSRLDAANSSLLKSDLERSIAKLEEVWEGEVGTLKHELWQTIQAHNHNADLMRYHKDAIEQIQGRMSENTPNPELDQILVHIAQVDMIMQREQAKHQQMDQLMQRLAAVQQQLSVGLGWGAGMQPGMPPGIPPGMPFPMPGKQAPGLQPAQVKQPARSKATKAKKAPKAQPAPAAQNSALTLRAEAPEFVPTTVGFGGSA